MSAARRFGRRLGHIVAPPRLGIPFRWLLASSWTTNLGDGIAFAAGPLLMASLTDDARLVALGATLQWLPPLLFGVAAGVVSDRFERRRIVAAVNVARSLVLIALSTTIATGQVTVALVLGALFVLGTAELFADNAAHTLLPMVVAHEDLAIGNARMQAGFLTLNQMAGPPIGAAIFAIGAAYPFAAQAVMVAAGAVLISRMSVTPINERRPGATVVREVADGFRWAWRHAAIRTLILTIFTFNITFGAAWGVLVLYAERRLGLDEIGFGLLTTVMAIGGLAGIAAYDRLTRRVSLANLMRIGLIIETVTHLVLAVTTRPAVAMTVFFVFGAHAFVWGTTSTTVRQRAVPTELQGRVGSVNTLGVFGGLVIGSAVGGVLAERWDVTAPFWFAFGGSAVFVVLIWRQLRHIAHEDRR